MIDPIKKLRQKTGAGVMECRRALVESKGDFNKAIQILKEKGIEIALRKSSREVKEGQIEAYIHSGGKLGVLVEINCETDFVARSELFKKLCRDIAMQIAATNPAYLRAGDLPHDVLEKEKRALKENFPAKSGQDFAKAWEFHLSQFKQTSCLLEQPFIRDEKITIRDYLNSIIAQCGENIQIRRFVRYQLGE